MSASAVKIKKPNDGNGETMNASFEKPYISITGITNAHEARSVAKTMHNHTRRTQIPHMGAFGVLVNESSFAGYTSLNLRCPRMGLIARIFEIALVINPNIFTVIHYACKNPETLSGSVRKIVTLPGLYYNAEENGLCDAIQLNGGSQQVPVNELAKIKNEFPGLHIIYQVPNSDLCMSTTSVLKSIDERAEFIDYVLFDASGGRGVPMDMGLMTFYGMALRDRAKTAFGFAGGLNENTVADRIYEFSIKLGHSDFSIDVERGVRNPFSDQYGDDELDLHKAENFFANAVQAVAKRS